MTENYAIYQEVQKNRPFRKQMQNKSIKEELVTYSQVETDPSHSKQAKVRRRVSERKGTAVLYSWSATVVILGILCFIFLLTTGILGYMAFQNKLRDQPQTTPSDIIQEDKCRCEDQAFTGKPVHTGNEISTCKPKWACCGENCYYFSSDLKTFEESKKSCKEMSSTLVKIEDKEEVNFIQGQISYFFWIGLSRKGSSSPWMWEDSSSPSPEVFTSSEWKESNNGNCGLIASRKLASSDCSKNNNYICKKKAACFSTK